MSAAVFIFPITYILSDVFSEVYGYKWSRITCYLGFAMNVIMVCYFTLTIYWKAPSYWTNQNAFEIVLGSTPRVLIASLSAFVFGDWVNDIVFKKMKEKHEGVEGFGIRAILSSLLGEMIDSLIFIPIAFIGEMPLMTLIVMMITQVALKTGYEIVILPITIKIVKVINEFENN